jgi:hypothetical protein
MAKAWKWTPAKVQRYLKRIEKLEMICTKTDTGVSVITICKYDEYQSSGKAADTGPIQDRYRTDTEKKKDERQREEGEVDIEDAHAPSPSPANDVSICVSAYNAAAERAGWPQVQKLTPNRSKQLRARLGECGGPDGWEVAMRRALSSDFLCGRTSKPWTGFGFDWLIKSGNFTKLMEGNYDNRDATSANTSIDTIARAARARRSQGANRR